MAIMVPPSVANDISPGERDLFKRLKNAPGTDDWIVLHSLDVARHRQQISGEIDFVIIIPSLGVLCLEMKACSKLRREGGAWYYGNDSRGDRRGPFRQAAEAMHSIRENISSQRPDLSRIVFWSAVVLPYISFTATSEEWHDWQVVDRRTYRSRPLDIVFKGILTKAREHLATCATATWFHPDAAEPYPQQCQNLLSLLRPSFEFFESPKSRARRVDEEIKRYTEEQMFALDGMQSNARVLFSGPAGTGKTVLALEAARRASAEGKKVLLLCFNRLLGEWMREQAKDLQPSVTTSTLHSFLLGIAGVEADGESPEFWQRRLPEIALGKLFDTQEAAVFDELVVDEAQDVCRPEYLDVLDYVLESGLAAGRWRFFGDFEKQAIFHDLRKSGQDILMERVGEVPVYALRINCRNRPRLAAFVHFLGGLDPNYTKVLRPDDGVEPAQHYYGSQQEQEAMLLETLEDAYRDGYKGESVVVLSTRKASDCCAAKVNTSPWKARLRPLQSGTGHVRYGSVHSYKGLEAPFVIITDVDSVTGPADQDIFYVGITRALERLVVLTAEQTKSDVVRILTGS